MKSVIVGIALMAGFLAAVIGFLYLLGFGLSPVWGSSFCCGPCRWDDYVEMGTLAALSLLGALAVLVGAYELGESILLSRKP